MDIQQIYIIITSIIGTATLILQAIPQLPEDHWAKKIVRFIGTFLALNKPLIFKK